MARTKYQIITGVVPEEEVHLERGKLLRLTIQEGDGAFRTKDIPFEKVEDLKRHDLELYSHVPFRAVVYSTRTPSLGLPDSIYVEYPHFEQRLIELQEGQIKPRKGRGDRGVEIRGTIVDGKVESVERKERVLVPQELEKKVESKKQKPEEIDLPRVHDNLIQFPSGRNGRSVNYQNSTEVSVLYRMSGDVYNSAIGRFEPVSWDYLSGKAREKGADFVARIPGRRRSERQTYMLVKANDLELLSSFADLTVGKISERVSAGAKVSL